VQGGESERNTFCKADEKILGTGKTIKRAFGLRVSKKVDVAKREDTMASKTESKKENQKEKKTENKNENQKEKKTKNKNENQKEKKTKNKMENQKEKKAEKKTEKKEEDVSGEEVPGLGVKQGIKGKSLWGWIRGGRKKVDPVPPSDVSSVSTSCC
jgi:hypothetical protein